MRIDSMHTLIAKIFIACCLMTLTPLSVHSASIRVDACEGNFYLNLQFKSDLEPGELVERLTDYNNLNRVNPAISDSAIISQANGSSKNIVWKKITGCIAFVCRNLEHTEVVSRNDNHITMVTIPEKSDFDMGQSRWIIMPGATGSRVKFNSVLKPSFALPPLIGTWVVKHKIRSELAETARILGDKDAGD